MNSPMLVPPQLGNQYDDDRVLRAYLKLALPPEILAEVEPGLRKMGELAGGFMYQRQLADRLNKPKHIPFDAWGNRIDRIELTPLWHEAKRIAATHGLVATAYERKHGAYSRIHQSALAYLFTPSSDLYSCPLAMTDGAARALAVSGNRKLIDRALPHLTSRDPEAFWTSGQWMTEMTGGSDVGLTQTVARRDANGVWRLSGLKWFTSAVTSEMALTLARPEGNPPGGRGLALFYVETRDAQGRLQNIIVNRLKDKLGTCKVPTAELTLCETPAELVAEEEDGVRAIAPMLNITRTWNAISAAAYMRRGLALAREYAQKRFAFGAPLAQKPLHVETLRECQAEFEAAFQLTFHLAEWIGKDETQALSADEKALLRLLTPIVKLTTAKQSVAVLSEVIEAFGGAGYVEDTGLPMLLRDAQVFPIWEGTTNVLALDSLRVLGEGRALEVFAARVEEQVSVVHEARLIPTAQLVRQTMAHSQQWLQGAKDAVLEAGARRFALTLGRTLALALLAHQAQWSLDQQRDESRLLAALKFAQNGVDSILREDRRWTSRRRFERKAT
ncbi:MAG: acyl-CoA dehydrogenase family protein [Burkholderiales bacterium]